MPPISDIATYFVLTEELLAVYIPSDKFEIRRRDPDGNYIVSNTVTIAGKFPVTNGRYFGALSEFGGRLTIAELVNDNVVNPILLGYDVQAARLYDDDTLVICDRNATSLTTFKFNNETQVWDVVQQTSLNGALAYNANNILANTAFQNDYFFALDANTSTLLILERQPNLSWSVVETFPLTDLPSNYRNGHAVYNGIDAVAVSDFLASDPSTNNYYVGEISLFMKTEGTWALHQRINPIFLGYRPLIYFGISMAFISGQTLVVVSPLENVMFAPEERVGKITVFSLNATRQWDITLELVSTVDEYIFGKCFGFNKNDFVTFGTKNLPPSDEFQFGTQIGRFYTLPRCYLAPLDVTCLTLELADCSEIPMDLYTFDPRCRTVISPKWIGHGNTIDNQLSIRYSFTKFGSTVTCSSTVACPTQTCPPVAAPISAVPVASHVPTASPAAFVPASVPLTPPVAAPIDVAPPRTVPVSVVPPVTSPSTSAGPYAPQVVPTPVTSVPSAHVPLSSAPPSTPTGPTRPRPPAATTPHGRPPRPHGIPPHARAPHRRDFD